MTIIAGRIMQRRIAPRSLDRAQWFSDLLIALNEAERLLELLEANEGFPDETIQLKRRIRAASSELESLDQVARAEGRVIGSCWPEPMPGRGAEA